METVTARLQLGVTLNLNDSICYRVQKYEKAKKKPPISGAISGVNIFIYTTIQPYPQRQLLLEMVILSVIFEGFVGYNLLPALYLHMVLQL